MPPLPSRQIILFQGDAHPIQETVKTCVRQVQTIFPSTIIHSHGSRGDAHPPGVCFMPGGCESYPHRTYILSPPDMSFIPTGHKLYRHRA